MVMTATRAAEVMTAVVQIAGVDAATVTAVFHAVASVSSVTLTTIDFWLPYRLCKGPSHHLV